MSQIFIVFVLLKTCVMLIQLYLENLNKRYYETEKNQQEACKKLAISEQSFQKTLTYSKDKHQFNLLSSWINFFLLLLFIAFGGFTVVENTSKFFLNQNFHILLTFFLYHFCLEVLMKKRLMIQRIFLQFYYPFFNFTIMSSKCSF